MIRYIKYLFPLLGELFKARVYDKDGRVNVKKTMLTRTIVYSLVLTSFFLNIVLAKRLISVIPIVIEYEKETEACESVQVELKECTVSNQILTNALNNTLGGVRFDFSPKVTPINPSTSPLDIGESNIGPISKDTGYESQAKDGPVH